MKTTYLVLTSPSTDLRAAEGAIHSSRRTSLKFRAAACARIAASVLGGAGNPYGAMIGALLIGEVTEISAAAFSPEYKEVAAFAILVLVMVLRPQGLLAKRGTLAAAG